MGGLAEAALAYTHDEPHPLSNQAPAGLTLVADNDAAGEDAESVAVKAEATQLLTEILRMDPEVKAGLGPEIALLKAAQQSGRASGIDFERIRDRIAAAESNAQNSKAESEEQKRERLWNEIEALQEDTRERMQRLLREGKISQQDYDEWDRADRASRDPNLSQADRIAATNAAAAKADDAVSGVTGDDADKVRSNSDQTRVATGQVIEANNNLGTASFSRSSTNFTTTDSSQGQVQAPSAPTLTTIAYNAGAQELTPPLETPAEAAAIAAANTSPRLRR